MDLMLRFDSPTGSDAALVGGKGANLGILTRAGFPVPGGFTVTTGAYQEFLTAHGLRDSVQSIVAQVDFGDAAAVEKRTAEIRGLLEAGDVPAGMAEQIRALYGELGNDVRVAVRSSGTAEDLEGASFAGQHDTYLHIRGADAVIDAVKRCWASLWTARATAYRAHKGFAQDEVGIAVVVQTMVDSEVSGVMFTANPIVGLTTEICINSSWGLGEAVVSGMVTPDLFTLDVSSLAVKERVLGTKEQRIRLDDAVGAGTITEETPASDRAAFSLTDSQLTELGDLGKRVMAHYDGLPQDTEWGLADGTFYLLQARPVTGAVFTWDEEVDFWRTTPDDPQTMWTRTMSDEGWTGAITPLFFSARGHMFCNWSAFAQNLYGLPEQVDIPYQKYYRGTVYWNSDVDSTVVARLFPAQLRPLVLANLNPLRQQEILEAPNDYLGMLKLLVRIQLLDKEQSTTGWLRVQERYVADGHEMYEGRPVEEIRAMSDSALVDYIENRIAIEDKYVTDICSGYILHFQAAGALVGVLLSKWYKGTNPTVLIDLLTGFEEPTVVARENMALWELSRQVAASPVLSAAFRDNPGAAFFERLGETEDERAFQASYAEFLKLCGHRGHADRDIYFPRRCEDPAIDYRFLTGFLSVDGEYDPRKLEEGALVKKRAAYDDIVASLSAQPLGGLKAEVFKVLNSYLQRAFAARDNQRTVPDAMTYAYKVPLVELNRRAMERGLFTDDRDFYFLSRHELYDVFNGRANMPLTRAKIAGRKHYFDIYNARESTNPVYLRDGRPVQVGPEDDGQLRGMPTSGGVATGTARLVKSLEEIDRVKQGEILVCNATDPGWTPVFLLLAGAVFETGGAFAHCSCISREYGIPAIQMPGALRKIPAGATITVDGNTGSVTVHDPEC
jgi:pyruvate,water dikinase